MNRFNLLKQKLGSVTVEKNQNIEWVNIDIPYSLKEICKSKFHGKIKWNSLDETWSVDNEVASQFERIYLTDYKYPTKDQKKILKQLGTTYDKTQELYYLFKFQAEDTEIDEDI
jgi:hypothetical protein